MEKFKVSQVRQNGELVEATYEGLLKNSVDKINELEMEISSLKNIITCWVATSIILGIISIMLMSQFVS